ncbi:DUF7674 family protein [Piscinibacter terrae]
MKLDPSVRSLLSKIIRRFPEVAQPMLARARANRSVANSTCDMMEEFARQTQRAVRGGNTSVASSYLQFVSATLGTSDSKQRKYIDVYFVEGLLHGLPSAVQKEIWPLMPANLRQLHVAMWGEPAFNRKGSASEYPNS